MAPGGLVNQGSGRPSGSAHSPLPTTLLHSRDHSGLDGAVKADLARDFPGRRGRPDTAGSSAAVAGTGGEPEAAARLVEHHGGRWGRGTRGTGGIAWARLLRGGPPVAVGRECATRPRRRSARG